MKLSQEFSRAESCILGALSHIDEFLLNPLHQGHFDSALETFQNTFGNNQGPSEGDSQGDTHPGAKVSQTQTTQKSGPDDPYDNNDFVELYERFEWSLQASVKSAPFCLSVVSRKRIG